MAVVENIRPVEVTPLRTQPVTSSNPDRSRKQLATESLGVFRERSRDANEADRSSRLSHQTVSKAVDHMNRFLDVLNKEFSFFYDKASGRSGVKVIDRRTHEVLKQIPPEQILKTAARIREMIGALLDEMA